MGKGFLKDKFEICRKCGYKITSLGNAALHTNLIDLYLASVDKG